MDELFFPMVYTKKIPSIYLNQTMGLSYSMFKRAYSILSINMSAYKIANFLAMSVHISMPELWN